MNEEDELLGYTYEELIAIIIRHRRIKEALSGFIKESKDYVDSYYMDAYEGDLKELKERFRYDC